MKSVALVGDNADGSDEVHEATGSVVDRPTKSGVEPPRLGRPPPRFLVPRQSGKSSQLRNVEPSVLLVRSTIGPPHFGHPCARLEPVIDSSFVVGFAAAAALAFGVFGFPFVAGFATEADSSLV